MYIDKIKQLTDKCDKETLKDLSDNINKMIDYMNRVVREGAMITMFRGEGQDLRDFLEAMNIERNKLHDEACRGAANINQLCKYYKTPEAFPNFTLGMNPPGSPTLYDGNTHYMVGEFCAVLVGEFFTEGRVALQEHTLDQAKNLSGEYNFPNISPDQVKQQSEEYTKKHFVKTINDVINDSHADETIIGFYDGTELTVCTGDDMFFGACDRSGDKIMTADCALKMAEYSTRTFGEAEPYFEKPDCKDGIACGYDVPITSLRDLVSIHGGIQTVTQKTRELEKDIVKEYKKEFGKRPKGIELTENGLCFTDPYKDQEVEIDLAKQEIITRSPGKPEQVQLVSQIPKDHYIVRAFESNNIRLKEPEIDHDFER